jgi:hypothetical protein
LCACWMRTDRQVGFGPTSPRMRRSRETASSDLSIRNSRPKTTQSQHSRGQARFTRGPAAHLWRPPEVTVVFWLRSEWATPCFPQQQVSDEAPQQRRRRIVGRGRQPRAKSRECPIGRCDNHSLSVPHLQMDHDWPRLARGFLCSRRSFLFDWPAPCGAFSCGRA